MMNLLVPMLSFLAAASPAKGGAAPAESPSASGA